MGTSSATKIKGNLKEQLCLSGWKSGQLHWKFRRLRGLNESVAKFCEFSLPFSCICCTPPSRNWRTRFRRVFKVTGPKLQNFLGAAKKFRRVDPNLFRGGGQQVHNYGKSFGPHFLMFSRKFVISNDLKIFDRGRKSENFEDSIAFTQNHRLFKNFGWGPRIEDFWPLGNLKVVNTLRKIVKFSTESFFENKR